MISSKSRLNDKKSAPCIVLNQTKVNSFKGGEKKDLFVPRDRRKDTAKQMEFMYCIPDLEVFIDKTIKKCLLEYDLDANDTEAVLDDMEKAWPKSPLRQSEKQVLRDFNDNSQKGKNIKQDIGVNQSQDSAAVDVSLEKDAMTGGGKIVHMRNAKELDSRELAEKLIFKREERIDTVLNGMKKERIDTSLPIVKKEFEHVEGDRSDTSSPDVVDGLSQARKHPKLKSLLQQRYFEGQESDKGHTEKKTEDKQDVAWGMSKQISSNLDLLASAADIHTVSARGTDEHRLQAIRRLQEESEMRFQTSSFKNFSNNSLHDLADTSARIPVLVQLMSSSSTSTSSSPLSSSSSMHEFNNHNGGNTNGHFNNVLRAVSPERGQTPPRSISTNENALLGKLSTPQVKNSNLNLSRDNAQQLILSNQNGYHSHNLQDTIIIRRDKSINAIENIKMPSVSRLTAFSSPARNNHIDVTTSTTHFNNFSTMPRPFHLQHNHPDKHHNHSDNHRDNHQSYTDNHYEPLHYHGSRIANIIAEELQKDDDSTTQAPPHQTILRISQRELKPSDINEPTRIRSFSLPGTYRRTAPSKPVTYLSQVSSIHNIPLDINYQHANHNEQATSAQSRTVVHILPAHYTSTNTHQRTTVSSSHLGHGMSLSSDIKRSNQNNSRLDEDQPQDLSTKSRRSVEDKQQINFIHPTPAKDIENKKYFTTPDSKFSTQEGVQIIESTFPSSKSNGESKLPSRIYIGNIQNKTFELEHKNQVQGCETYLENAQDGTILARNKRSQIMNLYSETKDSESGKRRKFE